MARTEYNQIFENPSVEKALVFAARWYENRLEQAFAQVRLDGQPSNVSFDTVIEMIGKKAVHTGQVVRTMAEIVPEELLIPGVIAAILHDLERSTQCFYGTFSDTEAKFDHAIKAAQILQSLTEFFSDIPMFGDIIIAVAEHSAATPVHSDDPLVRMLRDADKAWILEEVLANVNGDLEVKSDDTLTFSDRALSAFRLRKQMLHGDRDTNKILDLLIFRLSWMYDINEPQSKRFLIERETFKRLLEKMEQIAPEEMRRAGIRADVEEWIRENSQTAD